ncbi:hypothetical protein D9V86_04485 [Bacteroidetes/Chlorobi group bacterium ChocPot_Mid]|nr:MAG: hypothetical protein D9V86_04485 [Bacteroidetes/Chlorobi group bacterium ChocPot_Mid]
MKMKITAIILLTFTTLALFASDNVIEYLRAKSDGKSITVEWKTTSEQDINSFAIERAGSDQIFESIETKQAKGFASTYTYLDESAFKTSENGDKTLSKNIYFYRIAINKKDGSKVYSTIANVTHNTSSIRRTWGMLKEMFR